MVTAKAYVMANRVLEVNAWAEKLETISNDGATLENITDQAKNYVISMARQLGLRLTEEEIRETAVEIMCRIINKGLL